jgi:cholesterol transport system auxiliary component
MIRSLLSSALLISLLSACSILPKSEVLDVYLLPAQPVIAELDPPASALSLRVNKPLASQLLDSTRIAVIPSADRISAYQGARWSDRAPVLLRDRLIDAFQQDARFAAVSSDSSRLHADLELVTDLRAFQSEYREGQPQVHILLDAKLVNSGTQRILASQRFVVRQAAARTSVGPVVQAFGQAADQLSAQLVNWTVRQTPRPEQP